MGLAKAIEGDYIETIEDKLFFDVKGLLHPNDYIISFLRFFPHPEGERKKKGISYKKIYKLNERYNFLKKNFPKYLFYSDELGLEVQGVKKDEIKKVYNPRYFFKNLLNKNILSPIEKYSRLLCELFITEGNISENSIGITGSIMIGLNTEDSDIDIIIYGTTTSIKFQEKLKKIFEKANNCRKYTLEEYKSHYKWRFGGSDISFEDFLKSEQRKQHQGKFMDRDFFIRYIKSPNDWKGNFYDYRYENIGRIKLKAEIIDSENAIFTPCSYEINPLRILESNTKSIKLNMGDITEINSFRGRFCEQAKTGETVLAEGKLEKVIFKNTNEFYRILLTDQTKDKLFILN
ncbi:MAG: nucleotidyltransferase domain-containing protein [Candidatus Hermodarchaeota archaeon]